MKGMYLGRRFYRQMFGLVLVMILAPEGLAAQDAIATALDRIHREYSSRLLKKSVEWDRQIDPGVLPCSQYC